MNITSLLDLYEINKNKTKQSRIVIKLSDLAYSGFKSFDGRIESFTEEELEEISALNEEAAYYELSVQSYSSDDDEKSILIVSLEDVEKLSSDEVSDLLKSNRGSCYSALDEVMTLYPGASGSFMENISSEDCDDNDEY